MKKGIFLYWHGLGDVIMLTPLLRHLYKNGIIIDLMCRESVETSNLLLGCPYVNNTIIVDNPWRSPLGFNKQVNINVEHLKNLSKNYDWVGGALHLKSFSDKVKNNFHENNLASTDYKLELFIPENIEKEVYEYVKKHYPKGFIFNHTQIEFHKVHDWDSKEWIIKNLPALPIIDTGYGGNYYRKWDDIRYTFCLLKHASHRVLSSSVFVHACDALDLKIDVVNYGKSDRKVWPHNKDLIKKIREVKKWIK